MLRIRTCCSLAEARREPERSDPEGRFDLWLYIQGLLTDPRSRWGPGRPEADWGSVAKEARGRRRPRCPRLVVRQVYRSERTLSSLLRKPSN
jgi:hypothetical protein